MVASVRQRILTAVVALIAPAAGCVTLDGRVQAPPTGIPAQAVSTWQPFVIFAADPVHEGKSTPGLAGRLYLFGPQADFPLAAPGRIEVRLYPDPPKPGVPDAPLEVWQLDPETVKRKLQHDAIGWGYSLTLPWGTYRPDLTHVRLTVRFEPLGGGTPLYAQETHLTLHGQGPPEVQTTTTTQAQKPKG